MVSIDLDNIIHYQPPPISKPPFKPLHLTAFSHTSSYLPSNQPVLTHPLPSRPPCPSHESLQACQPCPQNSSPTVSSLHSHRDAHLNEFDNELADLEMSIFGSQEVPGPCFGGSEETQADNINDAQGNESHEQDREASCNNDRSWGDLRLLSDDATMPRDTAASSHDVKTHSAPTSPVGVDGHVSPNEICSIQDPSPFERSEPQLSILGYETEVNSTVAGEPHHARTSYHDFNVSRDLVPSPNPTTAVLAGDEQDPENSQPFRWSPESIAECSKSSSPPVTEAHFSQLDGTDPLATRDSHLHLEVQSDDTDIHTTDECPGDDATSSPIPSCLQEQTEAVSRPGENDSPRGPSSSSSVSVVVPLTRSLGPPKPRSTRTGSTRCIKKRKTRAKSACNVDGDDPDDCGYTDGNDSGVSEIVASPRLLNRPRRTTTAKIQPAQAGRESSYRQFSSPAPEEEIANPRRGTNLQDIQTIPIRGFLTRQTFLSRLIYSCTFEEDRQPSCPHGPKALACEESLDKTRHTTKPSNRKPSAHATRFLPDEDELLIELKEKQSLPWNRIAKRFPGRSKGALQVHYSTKLKNRGTRSLGRGRSSKR